MWPFLKQIVLFIYICLFGKQHRERVVRELTKNTRRRRPTLDIPTIPAAVDEVVQLHDDWQDTTTFTGFDKQGLCVKIVTERSRNGAAVKIDLDIPGIGKLTFNDIYRDCCDNQIDSDNLCGRAKLQLNFLQPMRRWRIRYRGRLCHVNNSERGIHTVISLYWQCLSDPYDYAVTPSSWTLARSLSSVGLKDALTILSSDAILYHQWGELRGKVELEGFDGVNIRLKSLRERSFEHHCKIPRLSASSQYLILEDSGTAIANTSIKLTGHSYINLGFLTYPLGDSYPALLDCPLTDINDDHITVSKEPKRLFVCKQRFMIYEQLGRHCFQTYDNTDHCEFRTYTVDGKSAYGIHRIIKQTSVQKDKELPVTDGKHIHSENISIDNKSTVISLDTKSCQLRSLVGGKACQLSVLRTLGTFNVPNGFCVTVNALRHHIDRHKELREAIQCIETSLATSQIEKIKGACDDAINTFLSTSLEDQLENLIQTCLEESLGRNEWNNKSFAVRSSSLSEDGSETSNAGQLDTLLCIQEFENIIEAIKRCWASSVSYQVVDYRRQNGQALIEMMGVVIQEMIQAEVSGVLFTCHPLSGNESKMVINCALGLGESIVSGKVVPDTIVISRGDEDNLIIEETHAGSRSSQIKSDNATFPDTNNTLSVVGSDSNEIKLTLREKEIHMICKKGMEIETYFGNAQDIEWALLEGKLHVLQTRPITSLDTDTDEELLHEFDSPVINDSIFITPANIQEMMPGAVSTLTADIFVSAVDECLKQDMYGTLGIRSPVHAASMAYLCFGVPLLNITAMVASGRSGIGGEKSKSDIEIYVVGETVKEHTSETVEAYYGREYTLYRKVINCFKQFLLPSASAKLFETMYSQIDKYSIDENSATAKELYESIDKKLMDYFKMWRAYIYKAGRSGAWSGIIMAILKGNSMENSLENLSDMALILSQCKDVYSAEVPIAVARLAKLIAKSDFRDTFLGMSSDECEVFLRTTNNKDINLEYLQFMKRHGHRGIREAEFLEKSWRQNPSTLMESLKMIIEQGHFQKRNRATKSLEDIISELKSPLSGVQKLILKKFLIGKAMEGVCSRELGKSVVIQLSNHFKQAYWKLAELMVRESRLPDTNLLFFLTHAEIGDLIDQRSAKLVRLAKRRLKTFPRMNEVKFPKVNFGIPQPIQNVTQDSMPPVFTLHGMPVCQGKATGRACVIKSLHDAHDIKEGDILVCRYTDVGWSPYFPLINGLITELGGLLSHGAVVARECAIPCIVNIPNATDLIRTGDLVTIDGASGSLSKL